MEPNQKIKPATNDIETLMLNLSQSTNESDCFYRVDNNCHLQGGGQGAQVVFKKPSKKKAKSEPKVVVIQSNSYLIDERERVAAAKAMMLNPSSLPKGKPKSNKEQIKTIKNESLSGKRKGENVDDTSDKPKPKAHMKKEAKASSQFSISDATSTKDQAQSSISKKVKVNNYLESNSGACDDNESIEKKPMTALKAAKPTRNVKPIQPKHEEPPKENLHEKRKQYEVPPVVIKRDKSMTSTNNNNSNHLDNTSSVNQEELEQKKKERIQSLMYNQEKLCIHDYQLQEIQLLKKKEYKETEKKLKYLEHNNINVDELVFDQAEGEAEEEKEDKGVKAKKGGELIEIEENYSKFNSKREEQHEEENDFEANTETVNQNEINHTNEEPIATDSMHQPNQPEFKPKVNQAINKSEAISNNNSKCNNKSDFQLTYSNTSNMNIKRSKSSTENKEVKKQRIDTFEYLRKILQEKEMDPGELNTKQVNSFRKSSLSSNKKKKQAEKRTVIKADSKTHLVYDEDRNFVCSNKKNVSANREDVREFMVNRRRDSKERAIKVQEEEKMKQLKKYIELSKIQEIINRGRRAVRPKQMVMNEYYVGPHPYSNINKASESESTIVDLNDMIDNIAESNKIITSGMSELMVYTKENNEDSVLNQSNQSLRESMREELKNITNEAIQRTKDDILGDSASLFLKDSLKEKVNNTVKRNDELLNSDNLNQVLRASYPKAAFTNSINTVSDNEPNEDKVGYDDDNAEQSPLHDHNNALDTGDDEIQKNSIQVPSSIYQSNILSINPDKDIEKQKKKKNHNRREKEDDDELELEEGQKCTLEEYNDKFERFEEWFRILNIRNALNDIIIYGNNKLRYRLGLECLILIFKSNPFSVLDFYAKYCIYLSSLRGLFFPYLRRSLYTLKAHTHFREERISSNDKQRADKAERKDLDAAYGELIQKNKEDEEEYAQRQSESQEEDIDNSALTEEQSAKKIEYFILLLRLPFILYSIQKIAEYAYPEQIDDIPSEEAHFQGPDESRNQSNSVSHIQNSKEEDKMITDNKFYEDKSNNGSGLSFRQNQTFLYESFESKSSIVLYPNSEKSDRLHRVYELIGLQKENLNNSFTATNNNMDDFNTSGCNFHNLSFQKDDNPTSAKKSSKSSKSIGEIAKMKPGISLKHSMNSLKSKSNRSNVSDNSINENEINLPLSASSSNKKLESQPKQQQQSEKPELRPEPKAIETNEGNLVIHITKCSDINAENSAVPLRIEKYPSMSEQDVSVDRDSLHGIDWEYNVNGNKSSSERDEPKLKQPKEEIKEQSKEESIESASRDLSIKAGAADPPKPEEEASDKTDQDKLDENNYENEFNQIDISVSIEDNQNDNVVSFLDNAKDQQRGEEEQHKAVIEEPKGGVIQEQSRPLPITSNEENEEDKAKVSVNVQPQVIPQTIESEESELIVIEKQDSKCFVIGDNTSLNSKELNLINLNTPNDNQSELSTVTAIQNKQFFSVTEPKQSVGNQIRYEEEDLTHYEVIHQEEPIALDAFADSIAFLILKKLLMEEITTDKHKLIPKKTQRLMHHFKDHSNTSSLQMSNSGSYGAVGGSSSPKRPMLQVNISANSIFNSSNSSMNDNNSPLNSSIFMKTVADIKKEITLNLYNEKIAPKLIKEIVNEIDRSYSSIYTQIKAPYYCNVEQLIKGLTEKDDRLITMSKNKLASPTKPFISKRDMLSAFNKVNKSIRNEDNITSDNYYDNILNDCLIDAANEIIGAERIYGEIGLPLPWSNRTKHIEYKYENNVQSKQRMKQIVKDELNKNIELKMGLIPDNYDYMDVEQLSLDREKKFMKCIEEELQRKKEQWLNYEVEETQIKLMLSKIIFDQLLNEIVEILEHVHFSRKDPNNYQSKSIYACEDIPRLAFQNTTENDYQDNTNQ